MTDPRLRQKWMCRACFAIYDPLLGDPDSGIPPGTAFEDLPADWSCPQCGVPKSSYEPYSPQLNAR